jgi:hypothetical protein
MTIAQLWRKLRCHLRWCGGRVVSDGYGGEVWIGWQCATCGKVKYYEQVDVDALARRITQEN